MTSLLEWNKTNAAIPFHEADVKLFLTLFSLCGRCEEAPEKYLDGSRSLSGGETVFVRTGAY